jgi:beta-glucuronidase
MKHLSIFLLFALSAVASFAQSIDLRGEWSFALDPLDRGESLGWHQPAAEWDGRQPHARDGWDSATVPHDFLIDPRYNYTGVAWYRRSFPLPADAGDGRTWRLQFDTVFQRCRVWLNGHFIGAHEGGYTPFEFPVAAHLLPGRENFLVVAVDNRVKLLALPGARSDRTWRTSGGHSPNAEVYAWLNYGGILGGVRLVGHAPVYVVDQTIVAEPDLAHGTASIAIRVRVRNDLTEPRSAHVAVRVGEAWRATQEVNLAPRSEQSVTLRGELAAAEVKLWSLDTAPLYVARTTVRSGAGEHTREDAFGIRKIEVRDAQFLLNGRSVRLAGANRARGHPVHGGRDPDEAVEEDLRLMKAAGLRFARLQHTAPGRNVLEWADRNGMLLILEVGMWGYAAPDLPRRELREQFQAEMRELVALAVNHPSVVGWSLGNEYETWTPEGIAWTRDMAAFMKTLDPTRPVTTPALGMALQRLRTDPMGEHAFDHVDMISVNVYSSPGELPALLDPVHQRWPTKPVFISEYGLRADRVRDEQERITYFDGVLAVVRERPWICGLSYWSFNDYASRFPGTGADGYRRWGLVDEARRPRALYRHIADVIGENGGLAPK